MPLSLIPRGGVLDLAEGAVRASQACLSCRKQKRKCDKCLPACSLCKRMGRPCDYTDAQPAPTAGALAALQTKLAELESRLLRESGGIGVGGGGSSSSPGSSGGGGADPTTTTPTTTTGGAAASQMRAAAAAAAEGVVGPDGGEASWPAPTNRFPPVVFLDFDAFKWSQTVVPKPTVDIPMEVLEIISRGNTIQETARRYFSSIHLWFPIISKKRLNLGIPMWTAGPDVALLFLTMRLVCAPPASQPADGAAADDAYRAAKRFLALLESAGVVSLQYLQAMLLVAVYEYGHAIYPAAWMTVAACARYAEMVGLPETTEMAAVLGRCTTWTESEERRRVWWGIYILDRTISLGSRRRFAVRDLADREPLPVDDEAWDDGDMVRAVPQLSTVPFTTPVGNFARTCQAAMLIDRTTRHFTKSSSSSSSSSSSYPIPLAPSSSSSASSAFPLPSPSPTSTSTPSTAPTELEALNDSLAEFERVLAPELQPPPPTESVTPARCYFALATARSLARSALVMLLDAYSCPASAVGISPCAGGGAENTNNNKNNNNNNNNNNSSSAAMAADEEAAVMAMRRRAVVSLRRLSGAVRDDGVDLLERVVLPAGMRSASPLVLDALYGCMATLRWLWKESGDEGTLVALEDIKRVLAALAMRWRLASTYLAMERFHDGVGPA